MLIYLCDDSESDLLRLKHYLNKYAEQLKLNFELLSFSSGEELLAAFQQADKKPELIFLDIFMEKISGMEAARQLRNRTIWEALFLRPPPRNTLWTVTR